MSEKLLFENETYQILGACYEVYRHKGCGFLEAVYQECLEIEFQVRGIPFCSQKPLALEYKGRRLQATYQPDFVCFDKVIVEIKASCDLADEHRAQLYNYLRASNMSVGLLINFGHYPMIEKERVVAERGRYEFGIPDGSHGI